MRLERVREQAAAAAERRERRLRQLELLEQQAAADAELAARDEGPEHRIAAIEKELAALEAGREERLARELAGLEEELSAARSRVEALEQAAQVRRAALADAERAADAARGARRDAERAAEAARAEAARVGAELAAVNQFVRGAAPAPGNTGTLAESLHVEPGYELALAAVLGPRLTAAVVADLAAGERLLDDAGRARRKRAGRGREDDFAPPRSDEELGPGAEPLLSRVRPERAVAALAARLLEGVWVVDSLASLGAGFSGVAVTRAGRLFDARSGELSQAPAGGSERLLEELGRRDELVAALGARGERRGRCSDRAPAGRRGGGRGRRRARTGGERAAWRAAGARRRRGRPRAGRSGSSPAAARRPMTGPRPCAGPS